MRIGLINVNKLSRVHRTFRYGWRLFSSVTFLLNVSLWWAAFNQIKPLSQITTDKNLQRQGVILAVVLLSILVPAFFKRNAFARLIFALITLFSLISLLLLSLLMGVVVLSEMSPRPGATGITVFIVGIIMFLMLAWDFLIANIWVLFLGVIPFGPFKAFRNQVASSVLLWSGRWKSSSGEHVVETGERLHTIAGAPYRLGIGWLWFILGIVVSSIAMFGLVNLEFLPAILRLEFGRAWSMIRHLQTTFPSTSPLEDMLQATGALFILLLGFGCFFVFGYFWNQWQRENMLVFRGSILQHITSSDVLLLRTFQDDVKYVGRTQRVWLLPFRAYAWAYTFEQLIVSRLSYLGKVRLLDIDQKKEEVLEQRWLTRLLTRPGIKKLLSSIVPGLYLKLPSKGGIRHYINTGGDKAIWQPEILQAMCTARMIVVMLGTTDSLRWEMDQIQQFKLLKKTVFVMPPFLLKKRYQARWNQFIDYLSALGTINVEPLKKVNPKQVLAVCVHENVTLLITGKSSTQQFYDSAIDIATLFTVADSTESGTMIRKYLT